MTRPTTNSRPLEVRLSTLYWVITVGIGVFMCGIGFLIMWITARKWPLELDDEGVTRRDGRKFRWGDATGASMALSTDTGERIPNTTAKFVFGDGEVEFPLHMLEPRDQIESRIAPQLERLRKRMAGPQR